MLNRFAAIGLGAVIALSPLAALAQTDQQLAQAAPAAGAPGATPAPSGSHRSQMRNRANTHKERARASAEHMRMMRHHKPATPAPAAAPPT
jgi:hypothetical protein